MSRIKITNKNVNSKMLYTEIHRTLFEAISSLRVKFSSDSHRKSFVEVMEDYFEDLQDQGKIEQFKVVCDARNNPKGFTKALEHIIDIEYKQPHCLNMTSIRFTIKQ